MIDVAVKVKVDLSGLKKFQDLIDKGLRRKSGPVHDALTQWIRRYRGAMSERFDTFSRGGGDWPALAQSTINARRHGTSKSGGRGKTGARALKKEQATGGGQVSILRDTGMIFNALDPAGRRAGNWDDYIANGVEVGFGGSAVHKGTSLTIAQIAAYHQEGTSRMKARKILVSPDEHTQDLMCQDMRMAVERVIGMSQVK
jgi:hypothetical protein